MQKVSELIRIKLIYLCHVDDKETLKRVGITSKDLAQLYGFSTMKKWYNSWQREKLTAASAEIVRKVAQHLLNEKH